MVERFAFRPIGVVRTPFRDKFGTPRQAGLAPSIPATVVMLPEYSRPDAFAELAGVSHIWLQFVFHRQRGPWKPRVKAPRLGGNRSAGVFATRSPNRPNAIGLSAVALDGCHYQDGAMRLQIRGADLVDGTPVLDIKPYVPYADCLAHAVNSFSPAPPEVLPVRFADGFDVPAGVAAEIAEFLRFNPAPAYREPDPEHIYRCDYGPWAVAWRRQDDGIVVISVGSGPFNAART